MVTKYQTGSEICPRIIKESTINFLNKEKLISNIR